MSWLGTAGDGLVWLLVGFWHIFTGWLFLFVAPMKHFEALWIIIPIWISWILTELYQEKQGTTFGNAISNGVLPLWAGTDWARQLVHQLTIGQRVINLTMGVKLLLCALMIVYGLAIIIAGIRREGFVHEFGRIRTVTYTMIMLTPVMYGIVPLSWSYLAGVLLFFIPFYLLVEWCTDYLPNPAALIDDLKSGKSN